MPEFDHEALPEPLPDVHDEELITEAADILSRAVRQDTHRLVGDMNALLGRATTAQGTAAILAGLSGYLRAAQDVLRGLPDAELDGEDEDGRLLPRRREQRVMGRGPRRGVAPVAFGGGGGGGFGMESMITTLQTAMGTITEGSSLRDTAAAYRSALQANDQELAAQLRRRLDAMIRDDPTEVTAPGPAAVPAPGLAALLGVPPEPNEPVTVDPITEAETVGD